MATRRLGLKITGIVQGVCFRACTQEEATRLGLSGWVRNRPDGSVEVCAEGSDDALAALAAWCEHGPPHAEVSGVERSWADATLEHRGFSIRR
jgi:acylphosphatase